ncbi:MAG: class I tRNA ligase family protein [Planctomycetaceae bacterium]
MFQRVDEAQFVSGEHEVLRFWQQQQIFDRLKQQNAGKPKWSFLDGPITANNPMGVHHAWGRTYKDVFQRYFAMTGRELRYQNGFDCQGLWVEVEVEKQLNLGTKTAIAEYGIDKFVYECKKRVLKFAARQTEQSIRLGYWMEWDNPDQLRQLADAIGTDKKVTITTPKGVVATGTAEQLVEKLGNPEWGGSYFTFSTENNETIWSFLKKCYQRGKIYMGHDVMPWSGRAGSAYSQMEIADGRKLTTHRSCFVRFPLIREKSENRNPKSETGSGTGPTSAFEFRASDFELTNEYLLVWTTTPWTLTSNVAAAINPDLDYVKLKSKKDGAIYYFAKDNLEFKRLEKEFKEGFGRPEWGWPKETPKLKTIAQIFKESGGYEIEGTVKGAEMVGWRYRGPFDELPAQQMPGGYPALPQHAGQPSSVECHRVVDGGRDFKGNPMVTAGEGTGIVHIAPGCGDVDHTLGIQLGLPIIAPLGEDANFGEGFGPFTGRNATDPKTADLVFEHLKTNGFLVYVETYPHIYPHCWRTGDELIFRLVDEWFINMDWRDEIKDVTRAITWLPDSIQGQEREVEWLSLMRDWMISKKRFWGLALPIWVNPADPSDFDVMGSLAELKERAVEGWDEFEGHTPHRPWIDKVKIKSQKTGAILHRIEDVGNPWLDAGIVPFSTLNYNGRYPESALKWKDWFPAELVTECFPGQFRNWFYSLLSLATMMRWEEGEEGLEPRGKGLGEEGINTEQSLALGTRPSALGLQKRPFKTLLGHRLVMNEEGKPMHKSDGTAIWFEEAAEQLGVDTLRWLYLAQNPAQDLRFGTRHASEPVTLQTVDGPISQTKEGLATCKVTSTPADEVRRQVLIPLWNSYSFFVNYAILDGFDTSLKTVPVSERPEIDRWILSNLNVLIGTCRTEFENFNSPGVTQAAAAFIDDLSNWYIRRNRKRFWKAREEGQGARGKGLGEEGWDSDKLAAYQTLYEVLLTLTKLLAPCIPFVTERMFQNLTGSPLGRPEALPGPRQTPLPLASVHLCAYPEVNDSLVDLSLNHRMALAQRVVKMGHRLREEANQRVRQPLAELKYACSNPQESAEIAALADVIADELNVKQLTPADNLDALVHYSYKPNLKTLGKKLGKLLGAVKDALTTIDSAVAAPLRKGEPITLNIEGQPVTLAPEDVLISTEQASDWACADDAGVQIALSTTLTPELVREGMARDMIRQVQQLRKDHDLEENDRIAIIWSATAGQSELQAMVNEWKDTLLTETRADRIESGTTTGGKMISVGEVELALQIART